MVNTKDEIMYKFAAELSATAAHTERQTPGPLAEEYLASGETKWSPEAEFEFPKPMVSKWPYQWVTKPKPGDPEKIPVMIPDPVLGPAETGETKWEAEPEEEEAESPEYRYHPEEHEESEYSDEEIIEMVEKEPAHVVTNLMLQRKPKYEKFIHPLLNSLLDWIDENDIPLEKGTILYDEAEFMLHKLEDISKEESELSKSSSLLLSKRQKF